MALLRVDMKSSSMFFIPKVNHHVLDGVRFRTCHLSH